MKNTRLKADDPYYSQLRMPLLNLIEGRPRRVLEIGCGQGQALLHLKRERAVEFAAGVELVPEVAAIAKRNSEIDVVVTGDIEQIQLDFAPGYFDLIIASHVLEHFKDPWCVARRLGGLLRPEGQLIGAIPNVRNFKVSLPLVLYGKFQYVHEGILDWTHTKFFTKSTIHDFLLSSGFVVEKIEPEFLPRSAVANKMTIGVFKHLFCFAYNFSARLSQQAEEKEKEWNSLALRS